MKNNERLHALKILTALLEDKASLSQLMPASADVSPMTKELCFGFCRHYFRLQAIADCLVEKKPKETEVWVALLIGLYQLHYMNIPDYAVVKETVAVLEKIKKGWAKGLVNAVLRNFCRKQHEILAALANDPAFVYGQPQVLLRHLKNDWPNDWQKIAEANDAHPPMTLRVNLRKNSVAEYLGALKKVNIDAEAHPVAPQGITLKTPCDVYSLPGFEEGRVSVQDGAAQLAVSLLSLKPGQRVLDACCAPGGKTCHILESEPNLGACVALDVEPKRLKRVRDNLERLHLTATLLQGDALFPEQWWDGQLFDRILLDAPCSATGVIRRHSDIKLLRTDEEIIAVSKIQHAMLRSLWPLLAPGGLMVYATCSVIAEENEKQIADFAATQSDCALVKNQGAWGRATGHGLQILPGEHGMDGFFYSVLLKEKK
ncbi:16S rRNA (cytosine(967)-C(5))-methyltransferase RsmB [Legionella maioricensis]|uniref:16S rRNA (cytosine(967)-C(5))-methyltransferase n=1 Tax=Legionella maioricensis TaxID=2896528 RepID=A0A9X2D2C8_9GAMM|nr:16S rRNA (cytosine(967)-C(5))-methyltransferase RsmB [Legionella maioricensis]MCL9684795.1 16S rRNA (cytosine(967)-C(5))-methyltransferase RsmB [Legionella maioricensis]MCL9687803.1 16S rRNA (cytosine(967)-C(5))-methyltransferase RsmB [Legionella maioricensis]